MTVSRPRRLLVALLLACAGGVHAAEPAPAQVNVVAFDQDRPLAHAMVLVDGVRIGTLSEDGATLLTLTPGEHELVLQHDDGDVLRHRLVVVEGEVAELIATLRTDAPAEIAFESSHQGAQALARVAMNAAPPGRLRGRVVSSEDGNPVIGARVYVSGTPIDARTNDNGEFDITLNPGEYAISIIASDFAAQTLDRIVVRSEQPTEQNVELTPAGLELPEFVVLEPYVEGTLAAFVEERRTTSAVADILGAEQIARAGDSDAAGALKRVTGLTLVDGKYVYVRGLGERYSSVLLNGAQIPSPDPTRRVVPLDLFPTDILQGVVIQKSFSPEMPGEFGGGTIQLRTKSMPESFFLRASFTLGYLDGTSFNDGLRYDGGNRDWTGYDDDTRKLPESLQNALALRGQLIEQTPFNPNGFTPAEIERFGEDLSGNYDIREDEIGANGGAALAIGDSFRFGEDIRFGYLAAARYAQNWDSNEESRRVFAASDAGLVQTQGFEREETERNIDFSGFVNLGLALGEHHKFSANTILVRQTTDEAKIDQGFDDSPDQISRFLAQEWEENQLKTYQLGGEHTFTALHDLGFDWQYTTSAARRYAPNERKFRFDRVGEDDDSPFRYSSRSNNNQITFSDLDDEADAIDAALDLPFEFGETAKLSIAAGVSKLDRDRLSVIRRFQFRSLGGIGNDPGVVFDPSLDSIFGDANIRPDGFVLDEVTRNTDTYSATQALDAVFVNTDFSWRDWLRVNAGVRRERNDQQVTTFSIIDPTQVAGASGIASDDVLPAGSITWLIDQESQLRAIFAKTVSRPDFRELSQAPFTDPLLDTESIGNPDLVPTEIKNYDLRYEYYFSPTESASIALFYKDFISPIEKVLVPGTGTLVSYFNADAAEVYGVELDIYKSLGFLQRMKMLKPALKFTRAHRLPWDDIYLGFNYAKIESTIALGADQAFQTNQDRPLQGQSPYVLNFQLGYQQPEGKREATLLYNVFGKRIAQVGVEGAPDIYEEPFGQLDFVYSQKFAHGWSMRLRLKNLLDDRVEFTQGIGITREYDKGREIVLSVEWRGD
jgi:outer membrane receptor protein involved in Fe transport